MEAKYVNGIEWKEAQIRTMAKRPQNENGKKKGKLLNRNQESKLSTSDFEMNRDENGRVKGKQ
jgi:hypothetical protein